ncbi:disease resistance protein [Hirschfeldia incana]|nr:disease resistance protein [Hirschfeldia incana]
MNDWVDLGLSSFSGALVSEALKLAIAEAKKYKSFKPLSKELVSTMNRLLPLTQKIDSLRNELDNSAAELQELRDTIEQAQVLINKFPSVRFYNKTKYARKIEKINKAMVKFCSIDLQLFQYRDQLDLSVVVGNIDDKVDGLSKRMDSMSVAPVPLFTDLCSVRKLDKVPVGLDWPLMDLKKRFIDNDTAATIVVSAPPGCGKTTLVTHLCNNADVKRHFKHILFNVVSSTPNFRTLVQNLLQHNGHAFPQTFENDTQAAVALRKLLEKLVEDGPVLLVLDDVWQGADSFLEKFRIGIPNYKVLVTSRSEFQCFGSTYYLKPLDDENARALLVQWASRPPTNSPNESENLLKKILKRCNGFPIVIEVVGVSLKGKTLNYWKGQVESWSGGNETILSSVLGCLQPSFTALDPVLKECFMDMGSFLEDQKIRASVIIDMWMELYCKSSSGSSVVYMKYLEDLASQNLLKLVPLGNEQEEGFYNEYLVTQHDILRELAIHQSGLEASFERKRLNLEIKDDQFPDWCLNQMEPIRINASLLSISTDDLFSSNWIEMDCPNVEALILNISSQKFALPSFIAGMKKLKVLIITNRGSYPSILSNFSYLSSLPNLKRIRLEKVSVALLDILKLQLLSLKKLSLVMCSSFGEVFYDIDEEIDVSRALPSLQEIDIDYCYDLDELPYWVCEVVSLKTLSITNCNKLSALPEAIGHLSKLEVLRLSSCINLSELPETVERLGCLRFLDISHCLGLRKLPLEIGKLRKLKKMSMRKCWRCELPESVRDLEDLEVKCDEETGLVLWERLKPKMRGLRVLEEETEHNLNLLQMF